MKKYLLKATALIASLTVVSMSMPMSVGAMAAKGNNLLSDGHDPGFEELTTITNTSYWNFSGGSSKSVISTDKSHTGSKSVKIVSGSVKYEGPQVKLNGLEIGSQYYVSAWVYTPTNQKAQLALQGSGSAITTTFVPLTANRWNQVSGMVTVPAIATGTDYEHKLFIQTDTNRSTDIYVDDFEICEITSTTPEVPVGGNLVSNAGFETAEDSEDKVGWRNASGNSAYTRVNSMVDANTGNYVAKAVQRGNNYTGPQQYVTVEPDTYYYVRAMVRQGSNPEKEVKAKMRIAQTGSSTTFKEYNLEDDIDCNEYTPIKGVVYSGGATELRIYVQTNESSDYVNLWFDDYVLLPITSSVAKGATGITPNTNITLSVPEEIDVNTTTLIINNGATITNIARDGRTCVVSFSGMGYDTEYTLKLDTVLNTDPTWEFKTESKNLIATYDPGFENGEIDTTKWNLSKSTDGGVTRVNTRKKSGSYSAHAYGRDAGYRGPQAQNIGVTSGTKYYASAWVYTDASGMTGQIVLQGTTSVRTANVNLVAGKWTKVEGMLIPVDSTVKMYVNTSGTSDIYLDDFELYKASDVTVSSPLNGVTDAAVDSDLTLVFSHEVNLSAANLTINGGAITGDILTSDNITYTVDLGTLDDFTDYTVKITGLFDTNYDRCEDSEISFTTTSAIPGAVRNMLGSYDAGFENGAINTAKWNLSGTVERVSGGHDSSYAAKSSSPETYRGPQAKFTGLTEGDQYYVSAWVRTAQEGQTAQLCLQGASSVRTSSVTLTANEWKQVSGVVTVPAPDASTTSYDYRLYVNTGERTEDVYLDDFFMTPYAPTTLSSSTPADETTSVSLRETISLTFSNTLDESQTLVDKFTVSGMTVTGAALQSDKKTVVLTLNSILDEYTPYTVTASGLTDQFGETADDSSITFTTGSSLSVTENAAFTRGGSPLAALTAGTVNIEATVANDGAIPVSKPVMIVTVYDAAGFLIDVVATEFGETLAGGTPATLSKTLTVSSEAKSVTVHIWTAANNISYMATPATLTVAD